VPASRSAAVPEAGRATLCAAARWRMSAAYCKTQLARREAELVYSRVGRSTDASVRRAPARHAPPRARRQQGHPRAAYQKSKNMAPIKNRRSSAPARRTAKGGRGSASAAPVKSPVCGLQTAYGFCAARPAEAGDVVRTRQQMMIVLFTGLAAWRLGSPSSQTPAGRLPVRGGSHRPTRAGAAITCAPPAAASAPEASTWRRFEGRLMTVEFLQISLQS